MAPDNEFTKLQPTVYTLKTDGSSWQARSDIVVETIESTLNIKPSSAVFRSVFQDSVTSAYDVSGPKSLTDGSGSFEALSHGKPISVVDDTSPTNDVLFSGTLVQRVDQGAIDQVMWTAIDDRRLLQYIPVRGALVLDTDTHTSGDLISYRKSKFISNYYPQTNPKGAWNCTFGHIYIDGIPTLVPMFASTAKLTENYESPDEAFVGTEGEGVFSAWTPRRFLKYLWALSMLKKSNHDGADVESWRSLRDSDVLRWSDGDIEEMNGKDPADDKTLADPLDRKMPDINFQGMSMLKAIVDTVNIAGTHDISVTYGMESNRYYNNINFVPTGYKPDPLPGRATTVGKTIRLQRGGTASDTDTAYDFVLKEDSTQTVESVYVEGQTVKVEAEISYDPANLSTSGLVPAWTAEEQLMFLYVLNGGSTFPTTAEYAQYPDIFGRTDYNSSEWLTADGASGRAAALIYSKEAMALARQMYPTVFRAWRLVTDNISDALDGVDNVYADESEFPRLKNRREVFALQLQNMLRDISGSGEDEDNLILRQFPPRVQIYNSTDSTYYNVPFDIGVRVTNDAQGSLIWLEGIAEQQDTTKYCVYEGGLQDAWTWRRRSSVTMKKMKVNIALPMDHRVNAYETYSNDELDNNTTRQIGGDYMIYVDSPGAYYEYHQVNSQPAASPTYYNGGDGTDNTKKTTGTVLNRLLPPGSEQPSAQFAAKRKLARFRNIRRTSSWSMLGIRTDYQAGDWLDNVILDDPLAGASDYNLNANVKSIVYDFTQQVTHIGGVLSEYY